MELASIAIPVLSFGAVAIATYALLKDNGDRSLAQRLGTHIGGRAAGAPAAGQEAAPAEVRLLREQKYSNWALLDQMIARRSWAEREAAELTRADVPLRVGEYLLLRWITAAGLALLALALLGKLLLALPAGVAGYFLPRLWVRYQQQRRRRRFDDQLVEAVMLLASTLKSGYSFLQGMEAVARELRPPIAQEFDRLVKEIGVGARADEALLRLVDRTRSDDLELVVTAIMIQRTVGGELAGILENIVKTVRERQRILRDIQTLTAQQRWSGYIIGALPIFLMIVISFFNPSYTGELLHTLHGRIMLAAATVMEMIGFVAIRRIIAIEV